MKHTFFAACVCGLLTASAAQAELVLDNFGPNQSVNVLNVDPANPLPLTGGVTGTRSIIVSPGSAVDVSTGAGLFSVVDFNPAAGSAQLLFNFDNPLDLINTPLTALELDIFENVIGTFGVTVTVNGTDSFATTSVSSAGPISFQAADLGNDAAAAAITQLSVDITRLSAGPGQITNVANAQILATPEPASLVLLGATAAIGGFWVRRKRKMELCA